MWRVARLLTFDPAETLAATVRLFRAFPFRRPDYDMCQLSTGGGCVNLTVRRCPTVELFENLGIPDLCRPLVCDIDFALAREWQAQLTRPRTLADGFYECDFHWTPLPGFGAVPRWIDGRLV